LWEVALVFLRLGTTALGGPAAHVALMENEFVRRRRWVTHERFLDLLGAVNLIPGPNSTEMAIYLGYLRAGWMGLVLGGVCFILPAMAIVTTMAWAYQRYGSLPQVAGLLYGVKPIVIAVIAQAIWSLGRRAVKTRLLALAAVGALAANLLGLDPLSVFLAAGLAVLLWCGLVVERPRRTMASLLVLVVVAAVLAAIQIVPRLHFASEAAAAQTAPGLASIFLYFLKIGAVLYGTGYVLLAFLQGDLVTRWHWLTATQLLDATAVGQVTPGPLFTTATFIGYLLGGLPGALLATLGIFLPSFVFIAVGGPLFPRLRKSPLAGAFLDGVNVAAVALMAVVTVQLGCDAFTYPGTRQIDPVTVLFASVAGITLVRFRPNPAWLLLAGGAAGIVLRFG
jgi:chromate transporter